MVLNVRIASSAEFLMQIFGGNICTTVLLFCNSSSNAVDYSLYIIFNFGECPTFSYVSYKTLYACNMSVSLIDLMGSPKNSCVSYVYSINMYWIYLLLVNGKLPVKSVETLPVSGSSRPIVTNTYFFPLLGEGGYVSISSARRLLFFDLVFFRVWTKCPNIFTSNFCRCASINLAMRPGHVTKFPLFTALIKVDFTGLKHSTCKKIANSAWVFL